VVVVELVVVELVVVVVVASHVVDHVRQDNKQEEDARGWLRTEAPCSF
jgi:hypothetical protein